MTKQCSPTLLLKDKSGQNIYSSNIYVERVNEDFVIIWSIKNFNILTDCGNYYVSVSDAQNAETNFEFTYNYDLVLIKPKTVGDYKLTFKLMRCDADPNEAAASELTLDYTIACNIETITCPNKIIA